MRTRMPLLLANMLLAFSLHAQTPATAPAPTTTVRFEAMEHDLGQVLQGSENPHVFRFRNTGTVPLLITDAKGSCGCTVPYYAKEPILPGQESEVHVVYKPAKQQGRQSKAVTLTANTEPGQIVLRITADVLVNDAATEPSFIAAEEGRERDRQAIEAVSPGCFVLFPNPTSQELRLDLKEHIGRPAQVRIHDTSGKAMLSTTIASISSASSRLDISAFPVGTYVCTIEVDGKAPMSQCFVVNR